MIALLGSDQYSDYRICHLIKSLASIKDTPKINVPGLSHLIVKGTRFSDFRLYKKKL